MEFVYNERFKILIKYKYFMKADAIHAHIFMGNFVNNAITINNRYCRYLVYYCSYVDNIFYDVYVNLEI